MRRTPGLRIAAMLALLVVFLAEPSPAQQRPNRRPAEDASRQAPQSTVPDKPLPPPNYETPLLELSETIGSLAFLTGLCSPSLQPNPWQKRMEGLVESEGEAAGNKERLMGAYNQGYLAFSTTYRQCTDAAKAARSLLVRDAARLARDIERRFGS